MTWEPTEKAEEMHTWREELSRLDTQFQRDQSQLRALMEEMESRLDKLLSQCGGNDELGTSPVNDRELPAQPVLDGESISGAELPQPQPVLNVPTNQLWTNEPIYQSNAPREPDLQ